MSVDTLLRGTCACGRNRYIINIPTDAAPGDALVVFDDGSEHRSSQAAPLTTWLRVPLDWYQSTTIAYFPDESPGDIRRTFTPQHAPHSKLSFCSYCGTRLSHWSEYPFSEADFLNVTINTLLRDDLETIEELGLLPEIPADALEEHTQAITQQANNTDRNAQQTREGTAGGIRWFEDLLSGSRLGRVERRYGLGYSQDGKVKVEWDISEFTADGNDESSTSTLPFKRKLGE